MGRKKAPKATPPVVDDDEVDEILDRIDETDDEQILQQRPLAERRELIDRLKEDADADADQDDDDQVATAIAELYARLGRLESIVTEELLRPDDQANNEPPALTPEENEEQQRKWREDNAKRKNKLRQAAAESVRHAPKTSPRRSGGTT
jgi:hypothetical protein